MQMIKASEFKAMCLGLMDEISVSKQPLLITKNGKPVSILMPYNEQPESLFGRHKDQIQSFDDLISPVDEMWDADVAD